MKSIPFTLLTPLLLAACQAGPPTEQAAETAAIFHVLLTKATSPTLDLIAALSTFDTPPHTLLPDLLATSPDEDPNSLVVSPTLDPRSRTNNNKEASVQSQAHQQCRMHQ